MFPCLNVAFISFNPSFLLEMFNEVDEYALCQE
jgi:hypothetical protein